MDDLHLALTDGASGDAGSFRVTGVFFSMVELIYTV
jgi:hypothetical protein